MVWGIISQLAHARGSESGSIVCNILPSRDRKAGSRDGFPQDRLSTLHQRALPREIGFRASGPPPELLLAYLQGEIRAL